MKIETIAVHGGYTPDPTTKAVAVPIYQTVAYAFDNTQHGADLFDLKVAGNIYTRIMNPTNAVLEARVRGVGGCCVTIDRHGADYLPQLYGPAHYAVIDDARKLPQKIAEIYRKLTA